MNLKNIAIDIDTTGICVITINRPDKLNALNTETISEIKLAVNFALDNKEITGVIITGAGEKAFVAGADIAEFTKLDELHGRRAAEFGQEVFALIEGSYKPIIAAVNGFALGGGCELTMACHMRVASENAKFGQPEVNLGLIPGYGGTQRLPKLVGRGRALEMMMTGEPINASQALTYGLVNHVTTLEELIPFTKALLLKITAKAPLAIGMVIDSVNASYNPQADGYQTEANRFGHCCNTDDFKEGIAAFLEKRKAVFKGR